MLINSLHLSNIRSYVDEAVSFPQGSVLLSGDIGAGKSSILHAIEFALFGTNRDDLRGQALLRLGAKEGEVKLNFSIGENDYEIKRALKKTREGVKQDFGHLVINGVKEDLTPVELRARLLGILGYPMDLITKSRDVIYRYTVYTPQEKMKEILEENKEGRLQTLRKIFNIDKYKRVIENCLTCQRDLKQKRSFYEGEVQDLDVNKTKLDELKKTVASINSNLNNILPEINKVDTKKIELQKRTDEIASQIKERLEKQKEFEVNQTKQASLLKQKEQLAAAKDASEKECRDLKGKLGEPLVEPEQKNVEELEKSIKILQEEIQKAVQDETRRKEQLHAAQESVKKLEAEVQDKTKQVSHIDELKEQYKQLKEHVDKKGYFEKEIDELMKTTSNLEKEINVRESSIAHSVQLKEKIANIDVCPTCQQGVTYEHKNHISNTENSKMVDLKLEIKQFSDQKAAEREILEDHRKHVEEIRTKEKEALDLYYKIKQLSEVKASLEEASKQKESFMEKIAQLESQKPIDTQELEGKLATLKKNHDEALVYTQKKKEREFIEETLKTKQKLLEVHIQQIELMEGQLTEISKVLEEGKQQLAHTSSLDEQHTQLQTQLAKVNEEEQQLTVQKVSLQKEKEGFLREEKSLKERLVLQEGQRSKILKINETLNWFNSYFIPLMGTMERHVMGQLQREFNELFTTWFSILMEDGLITARVDQSFTPVITQNGHDTYLENLSGGEKTAVALAFRLSLNKVINDFVHDIKTKELIILDEPTDGFSDQQLDKVRDVVDQLQMNQIIMVSHEPKIESFVDNVIRVHKDEHVSRII